MKKQNLKKPGRKLLFQIIVDSMTAIATRVPETVDEANHAAITVMNKLFDKYNITFSEKRNCVKIQYEKKNLRSTSRKEEPIVVERDSELDSGKLQ